MGTAIPEIEHLAHQFSSLDYHKKPKMLVVDDEPDNLDLLYRTFRRDFCVLRAESGVEALKLLAAEGEVAVIISDQRMPEMKGTEFLSKTVPQFPDTVRIILTGFTDVEDLVEAINSGQVYKYITKPWDPSELKSVVQKAAETYELFKQRAEDLRRACAQTALLSTIMQMTCQVENLTACLKYLTMAFAQTFEADICTLQMVEAQVLTLAQSTIHQSIDPIAIPPEQWLKDDPIVEQAIASQAIQFAVYSDPQSQLLLPRYTQVGIHLHLVVPLLFHHEVLAVLSLQWQQRRSVSVEELNLLYLAVQQVALALGCAQHHPIGSPIAKMEEKPQ